MVVVRNASKQPQPLAPARLAPREIYFDQENIYIYHFGFCQDNS